MRNIYADMQRNDVNMEHKSRVVSSVSDVVAAADDDDPNKTE